MARYNDASSRPLVTDQLTISDVEQIAEQVRSARARRAALRITGAGGWLDAGQPCTGVEPLALGAHAGIVTYEPGDFTLTARAGTSLAEIERVTAAEAQWLTLDAHGSRSGTLGATVATASSGPLASAFGTPRDHVLGCEFVSGAGDVVRAGGRVVKNVAGFDLVRLVTGAWGTVGALTEITVRLRARPEHDRTLSICMAGTSPREIAESSWQLLRRSEYTPLAAELISPALARHLGLDDASLLIRLGGNETFVRAANEAMTVLGETRDATASVWNQLSTTEPMAAVVFRVSTLPSRIGDLWERAVSFADRSGGYAHATLSRGVVRCIVPAPAHDAASTPLSESLSRLTDSVTIVGERLPPALWSTFTRPRSSDSLAAGVRHAFDPDGVMNPGILGGP